MSWYDYVPIVGSVVEATKGNYGHAAADLVPGVGPAAYDVYEKYKGAINEQKQGDLQASAAASALGKNLYGESMTGLARANNFYQPAREAINGAYGAPGSMTGGPAQYPVAPAPTR